MRHQVKHRCSSKLIKFHAARWFSINAILLIFCHIDHTCADYFPTKANKTSNLPLIFLCELSLIYFVFYFETAPITFYINYYYTI